MKLKNQSKFHICGLNQERLLNEICKNIPLSDIERNAKNNTTFKCSYFDYKKTEKLLKNKNIEVVSVSHQGAAHNVRRILTSYGLLAALFLFFVLYLFQNLFILQYEIKGVDRLSTTEVVVFIKKNFSNRKSEIVVKDVEIGLIDEFDEISFASCIIKGQTLVVNIKEKLLPDEMYGQFLPIVSKKDARITKINLISGTLNIKVGDIVRKGDILVEPYVIDTSGNIKKVEAKAEIFAEVYNEGISNHFESFLKIERTGRTVVKNEVTLFGLSIYNFKEKLNFAIYEVEFEEVSLIKNLFLPFKMKKTVYYELQQTIVESKFEDVKEEYISKAKENALEICEDYDTIIDEFYTLRHLAGVTIVNFCITTLEQIGGYQ